MTGDRLNLGDVVVNRAGARHRGLVIWARGEGRLPWQVGPVFTTDAVVALDTGAYIVTQADGWKRQDPPTAGDWQVVPPDELTTVERVRSVDATWTGEGTTGPGPGSYPFAIVAALLSQRERDAVLGDDVDWPDDLYQLVLAVAAHLDERLANQGNELYVFT